MAAAYRRLSLRMKLSMSGLDDMVRTPQQGCWDAVTRRSWVGEPEGEGC
jgi:hypothetical protein